MSPMASKKVVTGTQAIEDEFLLNAVQRSMEMGTPMTRIPPATITVHREGSSKRLMKLDLDDDDESDVDDDYNDSGDDSRVVPSRDDSHDQTVSTSTCLCMDGTTITRHHTTNNTKQHVVTPNSETRKTTNGGNSSGDLKNKQKRRSITDNKSKQHQRKQHVIASQSKSLHTGIITSPTSRSRGSSVTLNSDEDLNKMIVESTAFDSPVSVRRVVDDGMVVGNDERFYLDTTADDDDDYSIPSKVSMPEDMEDAVQERSYGEWMAIVRTLYESLQLADSKLCMERQTRRSRETNLVKLAKELAKRNEISRKQKKVIGKLTEQLVIERTEKSLLDSRLQHYVYAYGEDKADTREELEKELDEARKLRDRTCADYEARIKKMNKSHAKQCDDLCREVIDTNRENIRLKQQLADLKAIQANGTSSSVARRRGSSINTKGGPSWKALKKNKGMQLRLLVAVFVFAGCAFFQSPSGIVARHGGGGASIPRTDSHQSFNRDGDSSGGADLPFRPEELLRHGDDESDDEEQSQVESVATTAAPGDASNLSVTPTLPAGTEDLEVTSSSESCRCLQQEQRIVASTTDAAAQSSNNDNSNKKLPLRKRTGAWLRKRVAKVGSKLRSTFAKKIGDEGRRVQFFLRSRHANGM